MDFFKYIYQHTPNPDKAYVAWGAVSNPLYLSVGEVLEQRVDDLPQDVDIFFTPGTFKEPRRVKKASLGSSVVWVDQDGETDPLLPPTFRVVSGQGEHLYYVLDAFYLAPDVERANKAMLVHLGLSGDGTWDSTRFLRVPGSQNCKYKQPDKYPDYAGPLPCRVVETSTEYTYSLNDLLKLRSYNGDLLTTPENGKGIDRSRRDWKLASTLKEWGLAEYAIRSALLYHSAKAEERPHEYVDRIITKLLGEKEKPTKKADSKLLNATLEPVARLVNPDGEEVGMNIRVSWPGNSIYAAVTPSDFTGARSVTAWLARHKAGNRIFYGNDTKAKSLYPLLVDRCPDSVQLQVEHAGRYNLPGGKRVFIYDRHNALSYPDAEDTLGVYWEPRIKLDTSLTLDSMPPIKDEAERLLDMVQRTQVPEVIQPALGWLCVAPFKTLLDLLQVRLPILLLYGVPGSGKSSLIERALLPLIGRFGEPGEFARSVASDGTTFGLMGSMTLSRSWPAWFGDYRASNLNNVIFLEHLRLVYDGSKSAKGRPDQSIIEHNMVSPVIVDGENAFSDRANAERSLALKLAKKNVIMGAPCNNAFQELLAVPRRTFEQFAHTYLQWSLSVDDLPSFVKDGILRFQNYSESPRVVNSLAVAWAGLLLLRHFVRAQGWDIRIAMDETAFLTAVEATHTAGLGMRCDADLLVEQASHFHDRHGGEYVAADDILWFNLTKVLNLFKLRMDVSQLQTQLEQRTTAYLVGPERRKGGAQYWGIDIGKAQDLGLDVFRPSGPRSVQLTPEGVTRV